MRCRLLTEAPAAGTTEGQVEVFSWWTGGGEAAGLEAMIKVFNEQVSRR